jgi:hypothetical protein
MMVSKQFFRTLTTWDLVLATLFVLVVADRMELLDVFGYRYTGNDDTIFWQAAEDYSKGVFREPYFYGQNYNYMLEALVAVPLLWAGLPHAITLPLVTSLLALLPFIGSAFLFRARGHPTAAAICLLVPLTLPVEHGLMTCMSRGFVGGVAVSVFLLPVLLGGTNPRSFIRLGAVGSLAFIINPNVMPLLIMVGVYLVLMDWRQWKGYIGVVLMAIPFLYIDSLAKEFYLDRPLYNVHGMVDLEFSMSGMFEALNDLDRYFMHLGPVLWTNGWLWMLGLLGLAVFLWKRDRTWSLVLIISVLALFLFLGINKVRDGWQTIFHSRERMFLAFPVLIAWAIAVPLSKGYLVLRISPGALFAITLGVFAMKQAAYRPIVSQHTSQVDHGPVAILPLAQLEEECEEIASRAREYDADVVVLVPNWRYTPTKMSIRTYACPLLRPGMADTFLPIGDRRTWMFVRCTTDAPRNVLVHGDVEVELVGLHGIKAERLSEKFVMVVDNGLPLRELLKQLGVPLKRHAYLPDE